MDYLEGKVEKLEKEQAVKEETFKKQKRQIESIQDKLRMLKEDRDEKDLLSKKFKKSNETLAMKLRDLQQKNENLTMRIEQSF